MEKTGEIKTGVEKEENLTDGTKETAPTLKTNSAAFALSFII